VTGLSAQVRAPASAGTYCLTWDLVREGVTWFSWQGVPTSNVTVTVSGGPPTYAVVWDDDTTPTTMFADTLDTATLSFTNDGSLEWQDGGANRVNVSYHWRNGACGGTSTAVWDGVRTALGGTVSAGESVVDLDVDVLPPAGTGTYCLVFDLVREGVTWFSWQSAATLSRTVTVSSPP
jgi:hypothetical protein